MCRTSAPGRARSGNEGASSDLPQVGTALRRIRGGDDELFEADEQARQRDAAARAERAKIGQPLGRQAAVADDHAIDATLTHEIGERAEVAEDRKAVHANADPARVVV